MMSFRTTVLAVVMMVALVSAVAADSLTVRADTFEGNRPHWVVIAQNQCLSKSGRLDLWVHNFGEESLQLRCGPTVKLGDDWLGSLLVDYWPDAGDWAINPELTYVHKGEGWRVFSNNSLVVRLAMTSQGYYTLQRLMP